MKTSFYTLALVAFFAVSGRAQTSDPKSNGDKATHSVVKPDGTPETSKPAAATGEPKDGARMAVSQKGLPAPKAKVKEKEMKQAKEPQARDNK